MMPTATFIGYQENVPGKEPFALYNVEGGKYHGSSVILSSSSKVIVYRLSSLPAALSLVLATRL